MIFKNTYKVDVNSWEDLTRNSFLSNYRFLTGRCSQKEFKGHAACNMLLIYHHANSSQVLSACNSTRITFYPQIERER